MAEFELQQLKPLKPNTRQQSFNTFDIEAIQWNQFLMAGFFDGESYKFCASMEELGNLTLATKYSGTIHYAHYGGGYDHRFILDYILKERGQLQVSIIENQGLIIGLDVFTKDKRRHWRYYDSYQILKGSLDDLTRVFNVDHKKLTDTVDRASLTDTPETREYLKHDVLGLYEVLQHFYQLDLVQGVGHKMTTSSLAMAIYRQKYLKETILYKLTPDKEEFVRAGYYGGRNEIFRMVAENVREYDINSMYVFAMLLPLPCGSKGAWASGYRWREPDTVAFIDATVKCPDDLLIPLLPFRYRGKLLFPKGEFRGVFFSAELERALEVGYKVEVHKCLVFPAEPFLADYAKSCWQIRQDNPGKNPLNMTAKLLGNGLYGKFAQERERYLLTQDIDPEEGCANGYTLVLPEYNLWRVPTFSDSPAILPHIAAAITSYARIILFDYLSLHPNEAVYCDTDSVFLVDKELPTGRDLGELKFEGHHKRFAAIQPKFYIKEGFDGAVKIRAKGFTFEDGELPWCFDDFTRALQTNDYRIFQQVGKEKLSKLKEAMNHNQLLMLVTRKKAVRSAYSKRVVMNDLSTQPVDVTPIMEQKELAFYEKIQQEYKRNFKRAVRDLGGIRPSYDYDEIPRWAKRISGRSLDDIATELAALGYQFADADQLYLYLWEV